MPGGSRPTSAGVRVVPPHAHHGRRAARPAAYVERLTSCSAEGKLLGPESEPPALPPAAGRGPRAPPHDHVRDRAGGVEKDGATWACAPPASCRYLPGEVLDLSRSDGDLCVQACVAHPVVVFHALRTMRESAGGGRARWTQIGFGRTSSTTSSQSHAAQPHGRHADLRGDDEAHMVLRRGSGELSAGSAMTTLTADRGVVPPTIRSA